MVYDIRNKVSKPIFKSTVRTNKHSDPVWQVKWGEQDAEVKNFYSISSDGKICNWTLVRDKLECEEIMSLKITEAEKKDQMDNE